MGSGASRGEHGTGAECLSPDQDCPGWDAMSQVAAITRRRLLACRKIGEPDAAFAGRRHVPRRNRNAFVVVGLRARVDHNRPTCHTSSEDEAEGRKHHACRGATDCHDLAPILVGQMWTSRHSVVQRADSPMNSDPAAFREVLLLFRPELEHFFRVGLEHSRQLFLDSIQ